MRSLKFNVNGQIIEQDPKCDFDNLVPGSKGYLKAEFSFSPEWDGMIKVAGFYSGNHEYEPQILENGKSCIIPDDAAKRKIFQIKVFGKSGGLAKDYQLVTNKVYICQTGG